MDGKLYSEASVKMDGKTVFVNFFVPPSDHQVQIKAIRNVTISAMSPGMSPGMSMK